jgi:hypothetical protein
LAPTVGIWGVGVINSMAFSLLAYSNPEIDGNQEMELTIGSLNFHVGSLGLIHLSDLARPDPSARETKIVARSESLVGSSSEVNSPVSFTTMENSEGKIKELDKTMGNLDLEGTKDQTYLSQKDFTTQSGGVSSNIHQLTRVNSTNFQYEGLRIGGIGRRINSKVKSVKQGVYQK